MIWKSSFLSIKLREIYFRPCFFLFYIFLSYTPVPKSQTIVSSTASTFTISLLFLLYRNSEWPSNWRECYFGWGERVNTSSLWKTLKIQQLCLTGMFMHISQINLDCLTTNTWRLGTSFCLQFFFLDAEVCLYMCINIWNVTTILNRTNMK